MNYKEAVQKILNETPTDYITDYIETPTFFEFYCSAGGDSLRYRVYKSNGNIVEK